MIINTIDWKGRKARILVTDDGPKWSEALKRYHCLGRRWIKTRQLFSGNVLGNAFISYEVEGEGEVPSQAATGRVR
jgi:hypothetical protein